MYVHTHVCMHTCIHAYIHTQVGHSHVHYLKVVTKVIKHMAARMRDTLAYKYTVHSNRCGRMCICACAYVHVQVHCPLE